MMQPKPLPDAEYLRECFLYDPDSGILTWKTRPLHHFKRERDHLWWNKRWAGMVAGVTMKDGYVGVSIDGILFKAQRVIWVIQTGHEPMTLDHKNANPADNRWQNLREASRKQNRWNSRNRKPSLQGVYLTRSKRYEARVYTGKSPRYLGTFDTPEEAHAVWCAFVRQERGEFFRAG